MSTASFRSFIYRKQNFHPRLSRDLSTVIGIGTDIVYIPRITRLLQKYPLHDSDSRFTKLASKFMHQQEIKQLHEMAKSAPADNVLASYVAGIWATKESIYKSLASEVPLKFLPPAKTIYTKLCFKTNDTFGKPLIKIDHISMADHANFMSQYIEGTSFKLSISHDKDYVIAFICHTRDGE